MAHSTSLHAQRPPDFAAPLERARARPSGTSGPINVCLYDDQARASYDEFLAVQHQPTFYHSIAWRDVLRAAAFGTPRYLMALSGNRVVGVLPLMVAGGTGNHTLVSLPASPLGGPLADSEAIAWLLQSQAEMLARRIGARDVTTCSARPDHAAACGVVIPRGHAWLARQSRPGNLPRIQPAAPAGYAPKALAETTGTALSRHLARLNGSGYALAYGELCGPGQPCGAGVTWVRDTHYLYVLAVARSVATTPGMHAAFTALAELPEHEHIRAFVMPQAVAKPLPSFIS